MNFPLALTSKTRLFLTFVVVIALLAILAGAIAGSAAAAGGGGVSPNGGVSGKGEKSGKGGRGGKGGKSTTVNETRYVRIWRHASRPDKRWARTTSECESGGNPRAIGGGGRYRGAFQFLKTTWRRSPKSPGGDPIAYSFRTQAVVALLLRKRDGENHWPVCG